MAGLRFAKGPTRARVKRKKQRAERAVIAAVRAAVVARDRTCRIFLDEMIDEDPTLWRLAADCCWPLEWAHLHSHRRAQTRGQAPEQRHTTAGSLMLCRWHHAELDAHRLKITCLTKKGCDGPLKFERVSSSRHKLVPR